MARRLDDTDVYQAYDAYEGAEVDEPRDRGLIGVVTPIRLLLLVVWLGAGITAGYGIAIAKSLPMSVSGFAIWGVAFLLFGLLSAAASVRAARRGKGGTAFAAALFGGLCMLGASGAITTAIVLGLLASPT